MFTFKPILIGLSLTAITALPFTTIAIDNNKLELPTSKPLITALDQSKQINGEYIVRFKADVSKAQIHQISRAMSPTTHAKADNTLRHLSVINGFVGKINKNSLKQLLSNPLVESIEVNQRINLPISSAVITIADMWSIDRLDQPSLPLDNSYSPASNGSGAHAYIIDTGIHTSHVDFGGRASWVFTASDIAVDGNNDNNGHGTHMAGTVGGANYGVASGVNLYAVKVLDGSGSGTLAGLIEGINYVTANHTAPAVAVMGMSHPHSPSLNAAVAASIAAGVTYAVPAGTNDKDACNYSPASLPQAISAASTSIADGASPYSNHGSCVDIYAPGLYVKSAWNSTDYAHNTISHTPVAAAHVAGAAALILGADASCSPAEVSAKLMDNAFVGVLSDVPAGTVNRLLGVETGAPSSCSAILASCLAIKIADPGATDGTYTIDPDGAGGPIAPFSVECDMTTDGGGWTGITNSIAHTLSGGSLVQIDNNPDAAAFDGSKPYTVAEGILYLTQYDVPLGFNFSEFYLDGYQIRGGGAGIGANNKFDITLAGQMTTWTTSAVLTGYGDIGIGSSDDAGPALSLADLGDWFLSLDTNYNVVAPGTYPVAGTSDTIRVSWSQYGDNSEGIYPWWDGSIFVR